MGPGPTLAPMSDTSPCGPVASEAAPLVLGIESSCDETGVGVVQGARLLAHEV